MKIIVLVKHKYLLYNCFVSFITMLPENDKTVAFEIQENCCHLFKRKSLEKSMTFQNTFMLKFPYEMFVTLKTSYYKIKDIKFVIF